VVTVNRILIVDSYPLFRNALRTFLSQEPDFQIVGMAGSMRDAIWSVGALGPDLVLTDLRMPDARGVEAVSGIKRHYPEVKILVVSFFEESEFKQQCRDAGAAGYIVKDAVHDELCDCMRAVLRGSSYPGAETVGGIAAQYLPGSAAAGNGRRPFPHSHSPR
jgi:DNA-binding NarL/FixJ family response regulator